MKGNRTIRGLVNDKPFCEKVINLYLSGESPKSIHSQVGSSISTVQDVLERAKVTRSRSESSKLAYLKGRNKTHPNFINSKKVILRGQAHYNWKGGRFIHGGYVNVYCPEHPNASSISYVLEHRLVMERSLNRLLTRKEQVHHINGITDDNRLENLELISPVNHSLKTKFCSQCVMRKELRLLQWEIKELRLQLQARLGV